MEMPGRSKFIVLAAIIAALAIGGNYGWLMGNELGGSIVAFFFSIVGAAVASALVGLLVSFLGLGYSEGDGEPG